MSASFQRMLHEDMSWVLDADFMRPDKPLFRRERVLNVLCIGNELGALHDGFNRVA